MADYSKASVELNILKENSNFKIKLILLNREHN